MESSDIELLDRWRDGDSAAGSELLQRNLQVLLRFFTAKVGEDVEDLIQATMLGCIEARDRFRGDSTFRTFLVAIARYTLLRHFRETAKLAAFDPGVTSLRDLGTTPSGALARDEERELVRKAIQQLPLDAQMMLELHYWEGHPPRELAEIFELDPTTARTRLHRSRAALKERLEGLVDDPDTTRRVMARFAPHKPE